MFCPECGNHAANKALRSLGVRTENNSLSWDGSTDGKITIMGVMVRVSAKPFDLSQVETVTVCNPKTGDIVEGGMEHLALVEDGPLSMLVVDATQPRVAVCTEEHYNEQYGATIPVGVYFFNSETLRVVAIKCTETIHPIDPKYLPNNVVDLDKFNCTNPNDNVEPFTTVILSMFSSGVQSGGAKQETTVYDNDGKLKKNVSNKTGLILRHAALSANSMMEYHASTIHENGVIAQFSISQLINLPGVGLFGLDCVFMFYHYSTRVDIMMKVTPIT